MLDIDPFLGDQIRVGGLGGLGGMPPPEPPAPPKPMPFFDLVGQAEGTDKGRGYNETLGYGKFTGGDVDITNMTVADVLRLQQEMLNHPQNNFNSSAVGRYQVVGQTLRDAVQNGVLKPGDKFDQEAQQKVATFLAQRRGADVAGLRNEWAGLKNVPDEQIMAAYNQQFGQPAAAPSAPTDMRSRAFFRPPTLPVRAGVDMDNLGDGARKIVGELSKLEIPGIEIVSGFRDPARNARVGGAKGSQHIHGNAIDINIEKLSPEDRARVIDAAISAGARGVGIYPGGRSLHFDTRETPAAWGANPNAPYSGVSDPNAYPEWARAGVARLFGAQGGTTATAFAPQQPQARAETMPASFGRALGGVAVRSPMAERIAASAENPGASAMPERPVQVASADPRAVPVAGTRSSPAQSSMPVQGQPPMMEDYARGPDNGVMAFLQMQAAGTGDNSPTIGGLGGLGGMRMPQPSAAPAVAPSGPLQGPQSASPQPQSIDEFLQRAIPEQRPYALGIMGPARIANQKAAQERQTAIGMAKAMIAQGMDPNIAASLVGTAEGRQQLMRMQERKDEAAFRERSFAAQQDNIKRDNARADKQLDIQSKSAVRRTLEELGIGPDHPEYKTMYKQLAGMGDNESSKVLQRKKDAEVLGLKQDDPRYMPFVLTGNMPKETQQTLTAGDKKAIYEAEDQLPVIDNTISTLSRARELNRQTYTGVTSNIRGKIGTALPDGIVPDWLANPKTSAATREFGQLMNMEAIKNMAETLKGATTNEELARFVDILADPSTPPEIRERTIDRMLNLAQRQKATATDRIKSLRDGDYFKKDRVPPSADGKPAPTVPGNTSSAPAPAQPTREQLLEEARRRGLKVP